MTTPESAGAGTPSDEPIDAEIVAAATPDSRPPGPVTAPTTAAIPDPDYTESGVPTFGFVRDKIENRITTAIGSQELAEETPEGRQVDEMMRKRDEAAKKRLEEIRRSMGL